MTDTKVFALRRHEASFHEAGHQAMWMQFGFHAAEASIWPEGDWWAGISSAGQPHACDTLGLVQIRMIGVAGAVAQSIFHLRTLSDDIDWTWHMSESDWRIGGLWTARPDKDWRRAATLVRKKFDPEVDGSLWPIVCHCAATIRHKFTLTEKPLDAVIHDEQTRSA